MRNLVKLGLGGHSFIEELGNDPKASFEEQCSIVNACLDAGIRLIDTTYYQERVSLGKILQTLKRRDEAEVMAWNFYKQSGKEDKLVGYSPYEPHHIDVMLDELQTGYIDILVIHAHEDAERLRQEIELARGWMSEGKVKSMGIGMAKLEHLLGLPADHAVTYVLTPYNAFNPGAKDMFVKAREMGMTTIALSPFIRGWKLDEIGEEKGTAAEILLRWVTNQQLIDYIIVSMRRREWVDSNVQSVDRGPLTEQEHILLNGWISRFS